MTLTWRGEEILERARQGAVRGLTELDQRIEAGAKAELYPGHGLLTGALRRSIVGEPARVESPTRVVGRVAAKGVRYARRINRRYRYLEAGYGKARPRARDILGRHIKDAINGSGGLP